MGHFNGLAGLWGIQIGPQGSYNRVSTAMKSWGDSALVRHRRTISFQGNTGKKREETVSLIPFKTTENMQKQGVWSTILVTLAKSACICEFCSVNMHTDKHSEELYCILFLCLRTTFLAMFLKPVCKFKYAWMCLLRCIIWKAQHLLMFFIIA